MIQRTNATWLAFSVVADRSHFRRQKSGRGDTFWMPGTRAADFRKACRPDDWQCRAPAPGFPGFSAGGRLPGAKDTRRCRAGPHERGHSLLGQGTRTVGECVPGKRHCSFGARTSLRPTLQAACSRALGRAEGPRTAERTRRGGIPEVVKHGGKAGPRLPSRYAHGICEQQVKRRGLNTPGRGAIADKKFAKFHLQWSFAAAVR